MDGKEKPQFNAYLDRLRERAKKSRIHSRHQMIGLMVADTLSDSAHKALYIKMARDENGEKMLYMAKSIAENSRVENKGAYFMKVWRLENKLYPTTSSNIEIINKKNSPSPSSRRVLSKTSTVKEEKQKTDTKNKKLKTPKKKQNGPHNNKKPE